MCLSCLPVSLTLIFSSLPARNLHLPFCTFLCVLCMLHYVWYFCVLCVPVCPNVILSRDCDERLIFVSLPKSSLPVHQARRVFPLSVTVFDLLTSFHPFVVYIFFRKTTEREKEIKMKTNSSQFFHDFSWSFHELVSGRHKEEKTNRLNECVSSLSWRFGLLFRQKFFPSIVLFFCSALPNLFRSLCQNSLGTFRFDG